MKNREFASKLEERTERFAEQVIELCSRAPRNTINNEIIKQLIRSASSIGANYKELNSAASSKDFIYRARICRKESKETQYWLRLFAKSSPKLNDDMVELKAEANELMLIFSKIVGSTRQLKTKPLKTK